jgi:hypothetical protein
MRSSRKILLIAVLAVLIIGGTLGGVAIAKADDQNNTTTTVVATSNQTQDRLSTLMDKVAEIYQQNTGVTLDSQQLSTAFKQAEEAIRNDRIGSFLDKLVENGKITQDQADQFTQWWNSKPDVPLNLGAGGLPGKFGGKVGRFGGMFRGWCLPDTSNS